LIVVDTSVLIDFMRGDQTSATSELHRLETENLPYSIPAFCCQELLAGARNEREWKTLRRHLQCQRIFSSANSLITHIEAARIFFDCRRKGITIRSAVDCFIAQLVLERDGILLHDDRDYEKIGIVRPLRTMG